MKAVQTRNGKLRIAWDLVEMVDHAKEDEDYWDVIRNIEEGLNFKKLLDEDPHKCYTQRWEELRVLNTIREDFVHVDNLLVPPVFERPAMIKRSRQSQLNLQSIYASQRKYW